MTNTSLLTLRRQLDRKIRAHVRLLLLHAPNRSGQRHEVIEELDLLRKLEEASPAEQIPGRTPDDRPQGRPQDRA